MQCKQTSFRRPPAMPRLAQPLLPASLSSGCPWDSPVPARMVFPCGNGARCSQRVPGQGARGTGLILGRAKSIPLCALQWTWQHRLWRVVVLLVSPRSSAAFGFPLRGSESWWPCDCVGSIPLGRVTRWGEAGAGTRPPASAPLLEVGGTLAKACACLQITASIGAPAVLSLSPNVPGHAGAGLP